MEVRKKISVILLMFGILLTILPLSSSRSFIVNPSKLLSEVLNPDVSFTVDQTAKFIVNEDTTVVIIDLRSNEEFRKICLPAAVNIPYNNFIKSDPALYFNDKSKRNIFYSNGDFYSNYALVYSRGLGYRNTYVMSGGLNEWFRTIMESKFSGERISARENSLFEIRTKAGKLFTQFNTLPDSLRGKFMVSARFTARKLDGGCE
jgi:rhodanese-related sulfurtransferase